MKVHSFRSILTCCKAFRLPAASSAYMYWLWQRRACSNVRAPKMGSTSYVWSRSLKSRRPTGAPTFRLSRQDVCKILMLEQFRWLCTVSDGHDVRRHGRASPVSHAMHALPKKMSSGPWSAETIGYHVKYARGHFFWYNPLLDNRIDNHSWR